VESSAVVLKSVIYVGILWDDHNGYVVALDAASGSFLWRIVTNSGIESSPTVVSGVVHIGFYRGYLLRFKRQYG